MNVVASHLVQCQYLPCVIFKFASWGAPVTSFCPTHLCQLFLPTTQRSRPSRRLGQFRALSQRSRSSRTARPFVATMFTCGTCWRVFHAGWQARDQHCDATGHRRPKFECDTCDNYFDDEEDRRNHMDYRNHWFDDAPECRLCNSRFPTAGERNSHEVADHHYCAECQREFQSRNNLQQVWLTVKSPIAVC